MNIGMLIPSRTGGGAEWVTNVWCEELAARGHRISQLILDPIAGAGTESAVPSFYLNRGHGRQRWVMAQAWLRQTCATAQLDVVVASLTIANLVAVTTPWWGSSRRPAVAIVEHNVPSKLLRMEGASGRAKLALAKQTYRRADGVIGVSHSVLADLIRRLEF